MELAALDIKIGADLTKLQKDLNSAGVLIDDFAKDLATIGANSAAASGGMAQVAAGATKITAAFKTIPASVHVLDDSLNAFANEFNQKWSKVVDEAQKLPPAINQSSEATQKLQRQFQAFGGLSPFKSASADLSKFSLSTKDIPSKLQATSKASQTATLALGNLGRVAQDLPFGFIGIANNLNPLLEGFQRLSVEAKSTGTTVSSLLVKSLTGAGGLGLALSVVTAALSFASFGFSAWTRGFGKNKEAVDQNKKSLDEFTASLNRSYEAAGQQLALVSQQVAAAQQLGISLKEREAIIDKLAQTNNKYFGDLKIENGIIVGLAQAYEAYANNILKVARAKAAQETVQKLSTELVRTSDAVNGIDVGLTNLNLTFEQARKLLAGEGTGNAFEDIAKAAEKVNQIVSSGLPTFEQLKLISDATGISENELNKRLAQRQLLKTKELSLTTQIASLSKFIAENDDKSFTSNQDKTKDIETIADVLAKLQNQLKEFTAREFVEGLNLSDQKIKAINDAAVKLISQFDVPKDDKLINKLFGDIKDIRFSEVNFKEFIEQLEKSIPSEAVPKLPVKFVVDDKSFGSDFSKRMIEFQSALGDALKFNIDIPENIKNLFSIDGEAYKKWIAGVDNAKSSLQSLNASIQSVIASGLQDFFTSIGDSLAGQENPFTAFANILSDGFKAIGQALIAYGIQVGIIQKVLANPLNPISPVLAIAAGIALQAAGAILENSLKNITGLDQGGIIPPGYPNDTYLARLSSNEAVIPLDKGLGKYLSTEGQMVQVVVTGELTGKGNNIIGTLRKQSVRYDKTF